MIVTVGLVVVLAIPTGAWFVIHKRSAKPSSAVDQTSDGPKHRWWQP